MWSESLDQQVKSAFGAMVADAPAPTPFDELATVAATSEPNRSRRRAPMTALAVAFGAVFVVVGVIAVRSVPSTPPSSGLTSIFVAAADMPDDLVLRTGEVWTDGLSTTQIHVEADVSGIVESSRSVSITVRDDLARHATLDMQPDVIDSLPEDFYESDRLFDTILSAAERFYGPGFTYERLVVRGRPALLSERVEAAGSRVEVTYTDLVVSEGRGVMTEINAQNLSRSEVLGIAESLVVVPEQEFTRLERSGAPVP